MERDFHWKNIKIPLLSLCGVFRVIFFYYCLRLSTDDDDDDISAPAWCLTCVCGVETIKVARRRYECRLRFQSRGNIFILICQTTVCKNFKSYNFLILHLLRCDSIVTLNLCLLTNWMNKKTRQHDKLLTSPKSRSQFFFYARRPEDFRLKCILQSKNQQTEKIAYKKLHKDALRSTHMNCSPKLQHTQQLKTFCMSLKIRLLKVTQLFSSTVDVVDTREEWRREKEKKPARVTQT